MTRGPSRKRVGVVVMAKVPLPGHTKTRIGRVLGEEEAASLYAAMLEDRCDLVRRLSGVAPRIAFARVDGRSVDAGRVPEGFRAVPQPNGDLGACLEAAAAAVLREGMPVLLVDSDSPTLPAEFLQEAVDRLRAGSDLVMGPAEDGGYCFVGMTRPRPELFREMRWSTPAVVPSTLERARTLGLTPYVFPTWWDVDTPEDLERLRGTLLRACWPSRTARWLFAHDERLRDRRAATASPAGRWRAAWRRLGSRAVYETPWLAVREDVVRLPDGRTSTYSVIDTGRCVGVLPFADEETVLLVRQYRYVAGRVTWEMPTGGVHEGEKPLAAARRELAEEAHVRAKRFRSLGRYHTSKSVMDETAHLYTAHDLSPASRIGDETEFIRIERVPFRRALEWVRSGEITDSMTIIAVLRVALARATRGRRRA